MSAVPLFDDSDLPDVPRSEPLPSVKRRPRLRIPQRLQREMRYLALDEMLPSEHPARIVWDFVVGLDLSDLLAQIDAVEGARGRDATDPRLLFALWLYATIDGVGSARELDRLCREHLVYQWLCGEVSVNYHLLSDFRVHNAAAVDRALTDGVAVLLEQELVSLNRVAQDGMRVRASAGSSSFRRQPSLEKCQAEAQEQMDALRTQEGEDPGAVSRRQQAARERAARERLERVQQAQANLAEIRETKEQQKEEKGVKFEASELRASTTDPEARKMKMPDGGTRPGYNVQFATTTEGGIIVGVDVTNVGSDAGELAPMIEQIEARFGQKPDEALVDGGFVKKEDIEKLETQEPKVKVYAPIKDEKKKLEQGIDPYQPTKKDGPGVSDWRQRMGTEEAKEVYRQRGPTAEWVNAHARNRGFYQVNVRGLIKVRAVTLWYALAHNVMRAVGLGWRPAAAAT